MFYCFNLNYFTLMKFNLLLKVTLHTFWLYIALCIGLYTNTCHCVLHIRLKGLSLSAVHTLATGWRGRAMAASTPRDRSVHIPSGLSLRHKKGKWRLSDASHSCCWGLLWPRPAVSSQPLLLTATATKLVNMTPHDDCQFVFNVNVFLACSVLEWPCWVSISSSLTSLSGQHVEEASPQNTVTAACK